MSKIQYEIEYLVHSSALILYNCISNPSSLEEWFADSVNQKGDRFTFKWEDEERQAKFKLEQTTIDLVQINTASANASVFIKGDATGTSDA